MRILSLDCDALTDKGLDFLPSSLTELRLENSREITDRGIESLQRMKLQTLILECWEITNACILSLPTSLHKLELSCCSQINDLAIQSLSSMTALRAIRLFCGPSITDVGITSLSSSLQKLELYHCFAITDQGVQRFASMEQLKVLVLDCRNITDGGVACLPLQLEELRLFNCSKITEKSIGILSQMDKLKKFTCKFYFGRATFTYKEIVALPLSLKELDIDCLKIAEKNFPCANDCITHLRGREYLDLLRIFVQEIDKSDLAILREIKELGKTIFVRKMIDGGRNDLFKKYPSWTLDEANITGSILKNDSQFLKI